MFSRVFETCSNGHLVISRVLVLWDALGTLPLRSNLVFSRVFQIFPINNLAFSRVLNNCPALEATMARLESPRNLVARNPRVLPFVCELAGAWLC